MYLYTVFKLLDFRLFSATLFILIVVFAGSVQAQNLISNGNFELEGSSGFKYTEPPYFWRTPPFALTSQPGDIAFVASPHIFNRDFEIDGDHSTGFGKMMVVDGATVTGSNMYVWQAGLNAEGVCNLQVGQTYTFSYWVRSVSQEVTNNATRANLVIDFENASQIILVEGATMAPLPADKWRRVVYRFRADQPCVKIGLRNTNTSALGNDFALDDMELFAPAEFLNLVYNAIPTSCYNTNDGALVVYGIGGRPPYQFQLNNQGWSDKFIFNDLSAQGTYLLRVKDANQTVVSVANVVVNAPINPLQISSSLADPACGNTPINLLAMGGSSYTWTSSPTDPNLTPLIGSLVQARPVVNTTYTVSSTSNGNRNLIFNGDFSLGNVGFVTDYTFYLDGTSGGIQKAYGITTSSRQYFQFFVDCKDKSGSGQMMVIDGSSNASDRVWSQTIPVTPNTQYRFSYWIQSVVSTSPARIQTSVNNAPITGDPSTSTYTAPSSTCQWQQVVYNWNSGNNTVATITLFDRNEQTNGNDFAIDDISMVNNYNCNLSKSIAITVLPTPATATVSIQSPGCGETVGSFQVNSPIGAGLSYSINGTTYNNTTGSFSALAPGTYSLTTRNGIGCISAPLSVIIPQPPDIPVQPVIQILDQPTCNNAQGRLQVTQPVGAGIVYTINNQPTQYPSGQVINLPPGTYTIRARNAAGCISAVTQFIINPIPSPPIVAPINGLNEICRRGNNQTLFSSSTAGGIWTSLQPNIARVDNGGRVTAINNGTATIQYTVVVSGCSTTVSKNILVTDFDVQLSASPQPVVEQQLLRLNSSAAEPYQALSWIPSDKFTQPLLLSQQITADSTSRYGIVARSAKGCIDTGFVDVTVVPISRDVFVPNAFTPNGDGKNDVFKVYGNFINKMELRVFDAWGRLLFISTQPDRGWDGRHQGQNQPSGVYLYTLIAEIQGGREIRKSGSFQLIR